MRLFDFLNENTLIKIDVLDKLLPEYSEILKLYKKSGNFLYRGSNKSGVFVKIKP